MKTQKLIFLLAVLFLLVPLASHAQTHQFCPTDATCTWTGPQTFNGPVSIPGNVSVGGTLGAKHIDTLSDCSNSAFANTAACQTDANTTGGMFFPPNYSVGAFTNSSNRPVFDITKVDWRGFVNVKDFGAKGDNVADDTAAIQAAINFVCTGNSTTAPTGATCTTVSGFPLAGTVFLPAGTYRTSAPILQYTAVGLQGAGKLATRIVKINNTVGTLGTIQVSTGAGRTATSCSGSPCIDNYNVDAIIEVVEQYTPGSPNLGTGYATYWSIRDMELFGAGTNGTGFGIFAPRAARFEIANVYMFGNCTNGNASGCGSVSGRGFTTFDSFTYAMRNSIADSWTFPFTHQNDGSNAGSGTSATYESNTAIFAGSQGYGFYGLSYSHFIGNAMDHFNVAGIDVNNLSNVFAAYGFSACQGIVMSGGGAEDITGTILALDSSSVTVAGGFKSFTQKGFTSAMGSQATVYVSSSQLTMIGTIFSAISPAGNFFNTVIQGGSSVLDDNATMPSGGNAFIGYGGGSLKIDRSASGMTLTNSSSSRTLTVAGDTLFAAPPPLGNTTPNSIKATTITETNLLISNAAPTISAGFGTSPSVVNQNGTAAFAINVGTGGTATNGTIGLPTSTNGWVCFCEDQTTTSATVSRCKQTGGTTSTAVIGNFNATPAAAAWVASDIVTVSCFAR